MGKRYKEFIIDVITKTYQIIFAGLVIAPIASKNFDFILMAGGVVSIFFLWIWAGLIFSKMEE